MSDDASNSSKGTYFACSFSNDLSEWGSNISTFMPKPFAIPTTWRPMLPVPTTPRVFPKRLKPSNADVLNLPSSRTWWNASKILRESVSMSAKVNSATVCAPYLGTLHTTIPFSFAYAMSIWSKPVERVAMHFKFGSASICSFLNSEDVNRETTFASEFSASDFAETVPSRYTTVWSFNTGAKISRVSSSELKIKTFMWRLYCIYEQKVGVSVQSVFNCMRRQ